VVQDVDPEFSPSTEKTKQNKTNKQKTPAIVLSTQQIFAKATLLN
jgi:hypothetical protein